MTKRQRQEMENRKGSTESAAGEGAGRKPIFLHSCCGPCSTAVIERLAENYDITVFFYNPNVTNEGEYHKRFETEKQFVEAYNRVLPEDRSVKLVEGKYDPEEYLRFVRGLELEPENGARCTKCFEFRMEETAREARERGFTLFTTTLSVSPHKNADNVNRIGEEAGKRYGVKYLFADFKKKNGYLRSLELSREYELYRQDYCGCRYSNQKNSDLSTMQNDNDLMHSD